MNGAIPLLPTSIFRHGQGNLSLAFLCSSARYIYSKLDMLLWWDKSKESLTLNPLTWKIWWAPNNASRWQMGFNSAFKGLTLNALTWKIWWAPNNASRRQMGFNSAFKGLTYTLLMVWYWCYSWPVLSEWLRPFNSKNYPSLWLRCIS